MRDLSQIVEELHLINQQVIMKDNLISKMQSVVDLVSQMLTDASFVHAEIYLDLRVKYLTQIEELLKKINTDQAQVTIEPENIIPPKPTQGQKSRTFTKDDVTGPIVTDIYQAPGCRKTYVRQKKTSSSGTKDAEGSHDYYEIMIRDRPYYLKTTPPTKEGEEQEIYDDQLSIAGHLKGDTLTIITDAKQMTTETYHLKQITSEQGEHLFGPYYVTCPWPSELRALEGHRLG